MENRKKKICALKIKHKKRMSQRTLVGGDTHTECWEGGKAVLDDFRKQYRRRAEDMDSFGLAIQRIANHVNTLQRTVEQLTDKYDDVKPPSEKCKVCLPTEYAGSQTELSRTRAEDPLLVEALKADILPRLPFDRVCDLKTVPAELVNSPPWLSQ